MSTADWTKALAISFAWTLVGVGGMKAFGRAYIAPISAGWLLGYVFLMGMIGNGPREAGYLVVIWLGSLAIMVGIAGVIVLMLGIA